MRYDWCSVSHDNVFKFHEFSKMIDVLKYLVIKLDCHNIIHNINYAEQNYIAMSNSGNYFISQQ